MLLKEYSRRFREYTYTSLSATKFHEERKILAGESFGAGYVVGWFDCVDDMEKV